MKKNIIFSIITGVFILTGILAATASKPMDSENGSIKGPIVQATKTPLGTPVPYPERTKDPTPKPTATVVPTN